MVDSNQKISDVGEMEGGKIRRSVSKYAHYSNKLLF
jgi:hypothetical protein